MWFYKANVCNFVTFNAWKDFRSDKKVLKRLDNMSVANDLIKSVVADF